VTRFLWLLTLLGLTIGLWLLIDRPSTPQLVTEPPELLLRSGGQGTTMSNNQRAFSLSNRAMGLPERIRFAAGDEPFEHVFTSTDGLGDPNNGNSCLGCHINNGRSVPADGQVTAPGVILLINMGIDAEGQQIPHPELGLQLQDRGQQAEGTLTVNWEETSGTFPDGTPYSLRSPLVVVDGVDLGDAFTSLRVAPPVFGGGLLESIPSTELESGADPQDRNQDGISGRTAQTDAGIGRFGWKAQRPTIATFTQGAFEADFNLDFDLAAEHFGNDFLEDTAFYTSTVAVPALRQRTDPEVLAGAAWFVQVGCASCHNTTPWKTGENPVQALANQTIVPFTDLLLHDMGDNLADGLAQGNATGSEWRTPPLWGIGLTGVVGHEHYLHDGRARTPEEAILWHGGEAQVARDTYMSLAASDRALVLRFLAAL